MRRTRPGIGPTASMRHPLAGWADQPDAGIRGQRNEPARLAMVLDTIAGLRGEEPAAVARATTANAQRLFGFVAAGGSVGALVAPLVVGRVAPKLGIVPLLIAAAVLLQVGVVCVGRLVRWSRENDAGALAGHASERVGGGILAGFRLTARSPYLLGVALLITLYSLGSTILYVEQTRLVAEAIPDRGARVALFANVDLTINTLTTVIELVGTGWVMSRLGLGVALVCLPALTVVGMTVYGFFPTLAVLIVVGVARRVVYFALERPARETLFTVVTAEEKYKAKSFLDTVVYRGADWCASKLPDVAGAIGVVGPAIALAFAPVAALGLPLAFFLARRQRALAPKEIPHENPS